MHHPTVAVIGTGISGLTSTKMLTDYGIEHVCLEASDRVGGNWAFGNPNGHSSAYRSLHIDTSRDRLSFRDFPMPEHFPHFPHHSQIKEYLDAYTDAFGLRERIEFGNGVLAARHLDGGGWELDTERTGTRRVDALVVGNGHHWDPRMAEYPGTYIGEVIHSHAYVDPWDPLDLTGKRILVIGLGNSAADILVELSSRTLGNQVTVSTRSGAWIVPKFFGGQPADKYYVSSPYLPTSWQRKLFQAMQPLTAGRPEDYGLPTPNHKFFEAHPTQSVELPLRLGSGDVTARPGIERWDDRTVHFVDGTSDEFDVVIHATGYNITFPFFDPDFLSADESNHLPLYKRMFSPGLDDLAFVGFAQATPTLFPFVECQSRLVAAWAAGLYRTPDVATMNRVVEQEEQRYLGHMHRSARHTQQVDHYLYEHDMRTREIPAGRERARRLGPAPFVSAPTAAGTA